MKQISVIAISFLLSIAAFANGGTNNSNTTTVQLTGFVVDDRNNETLAGATVYVDGKRYYSDLDGNFSISDVKAGKCQIKVELISYQPVTIEIEVNKNANVIIPLPQISSAAKETNIALVQ